MTIKYTLVSKNSVILCDSEKNFPSGSDGYGSTINNIDIETIKSTILHKIITSKQTKLSYSYSNYLFHCFKTSNIIFLCLCEESFGKRIPFAYLQDLKVCFYERYSKDVIFEASTPYKLKEFSHLIREKTEYYNNNNNEDKIKLAKQEIDGVKDVMVQNIERVLERGERMELLMNKTNNLNETAINFRNKSTALRSNLRWKNLKTIAIIGTIVLTLSVFVCFVVVY